MMVLREETRIAAGAVREALAAAHAGAAGVRVQAKGALDVVTDVDVRVEDVVRGVLRRELGEDAAVLGEERGGVDVRDGGTFWVVDPICGTRNFASGLPLLVIGAGELTRGLSPIERTVALRVCVDVIVMAPELPGGHPGRAARCGAQLLLDLCLPKLDRRLRDDLARACEVAVVRPT